MLQAADILLYKCTDVPVGEDQAPHIDLTLHLVQRVQHVFKRQIFPVPKVVSVSICSDPDLTPVCSCSPRARA